MEFEGIIDRGSEVFRSKSENPLHFNEEMKAQESSLFL